MADSEPMFGENDGSAIGYMCKTDWECEIGMASGGNTIYPSEEDIRNRRRCVETCGIVEVRVFLSRVVQEANNDVDDGDPTLASPD